MRLQQLLTLTVIGIASLTLPTHANNLQAYKPSTIPIKIPQESPKKQGSDYQMKAIVEKPDLIKEKTENKYNNKK